MSVESFRAFADGIDKSSDEFSRLAVSMQSGEHLAAYAKGHGHELSVTEADALIAEAHRELKSSGLVPLSEESLDQVNGGASALAIAGGIGAGLGALAAAAFVAPAAMAGGVTLAMVGFVSGAGVSAGGLGAMVGGAIDLIKGN